MEYIWLKSDPRGMETKSEKHLIKAARKLKSDPRGMETA
ncbi:hypothetical protein MetfoDRAFT_2018 [Methanotorris formicicus Mc-S-70]|uniref:Uncharacterized protein n=1 Tax=Methanotorris formicicus Mc-S-70 TaxID=647171 RepID=H1L1U4_9EURY|nr:hypothetical protein MetfoDRAFT_2018 [Methanotorris formicicus Mc-S-70]